MAMTDQIEGADWVPRDTFGARLALIRQVKGWNVKTAAATCGLSHQSWRNWEDGKGVQRMEDVARKIAAGAKCDRRWLMAGGPLIDSVTVSQMELPFPPGVVTPMFGRRSTDT